jgi:steroid delta-isomerase
VGAFYDANIGPNQLTVTREATFPSSSPTEIAYILVLSTRFPNGFTATVRGVFTYKVNDAGLITNLRGYWNMDAMQFAQEGGGS